MSNVKLAERSPAQIRSTTIADEGTTSGSIDKRGYVIVGLIIDLSDAANLTFQVSDDNSTWATVKDLTISSVTTTITALKASDLAELAPYNYFKVVASAAQSSGGATISASLMA